MARQVGDRPTTPGDADHGGAGPVDPIGGGSWLDGDGVLAERVGRPLAGFVRVEAAGAVALVAAVVVGLVWANSPWQASYRALVTTPVTVAVGSLRFDESLQAAVNDAAIVLFFFAIGLEIKRELVHGSLRHLRAVALPVAAAIGGMVVPAALYAAITAGSAGSAGWAVPMATDVALALGAVLLAGAGAPRSLVTLLLTLAVVDDIGVIVVIAAFYSGHLDLAWALVALALVGLVVAMQWLRIWYVPAYVVVGTAVWYATLRSGIHPTIAGVALGLLAPARPLHGPGESERRVREGARSSGDVGAVRRAGAALRDSVPVADRLQHVVQPWVSFAVLPLFALVNAGIELDGGSFTRAVTSRVGVAVLVARLVGKPLGIVAFAWLAARLGIARLAPGVRWGHVVAVGVVGGVGFTVSVYVAGLAFGGSELDATAKLAILVATAVSGVVTVVGLRAVAAARRRRGSRGAAGHGLGA